MDVSSASLQDCMDFILLKDHHLIWNQAYLFRMGLLDLDTFLDLMACLADLDAVQFV